LETNGSAASRTCSISTRTLPLERLHLAGAKPVAQAPLNFEGAQARFKRVYTVDLDRPDADGFAAKRELVDLLDVADPAGVSLPAEPGDRGLGNPFSFPLRSIESILPLPDNRLMVANDNNYPFDAGRHDGRPDGNEWIAVRPARRLEAFPQR
jgi:hypothetical protein